MTVPLQVVLATPVTLSPAGSVSTSGAVSTAGVALALLSVSVSVDVPPWAMVAGVNDLPRVGAAGPAGMTVRVATAGAVLLPLEVCKAPTARELIYSPPAAALTSTLTVQVLFAAIVPPVSVTVEAVVVTVPPQVFAAFGVAATTTLMGKVSTSGVLRTAAVVSALLSVIVRVDTPPSSMVAGLKALPRVGGTGVTGGVPHAAIDTTFESIVTAPFCARARPESVALVVKVTLVNARMLPTNAVPVPTVAELPTCQNTLHACAPLIVMTEALLPVIRVLPILNTQTAFGSPCASSVSMPDSDAEDAKQ